MGKQVEAFLQSALDHGEIGKYQLGMVAHARDPSALEAEAGNYDLRPTWAMQQDAVSKKKKKERNKEYL
jgi:hypothetical protein